MRLLKIPILALAILLGISAALRAEPIRSVKSSDGVTIDYPAGFEQLADDALEDVVRAKRHISRVLGFDLNRPVRIFLAESDYEFNYIYSRLGSGRLHDWAAAVAVPSASAMVIKLKSMNVIGPGGYIETLRHELVHLFLGTADIPLWLNEGLAQYASGRVLTSEESRMMGRFASAGSLIPLDAIDQRFPADSETARLAYLQSLEFTRHIYARAGEETFKSVLQKTRAGRDFYMSFEEETGLTAGEFFEDFTALYAGGHSFIIDFLLSVPLFGWVSLLVLAAFVLTVLRNRAKKRQMASSEGL